MEIASIKGDVVLLIYHPSEAAAEVGQQFTLLELPDKNAGLVIQILSNDSLEYVGLQQEMIQHILEEQISQVEFKINREQGMGEIKKLKIATAKIRKRINDGKWITWDGWIPTRNVVIARVEANDLIGTVLPTATHPLSNFARFNGSSITFDGPLLNMVNVVTGVKGSGKSHLTKHLVLALAKKDVPCVIFDINGEYTQLPDVQVLQWGSTFRPALSEVNYVALEAVVRTLYPLPSGQPSEAVFESGLRRFFRERRAYCQKQRQPFNIDVPYLQKQTWSQNELVSNAITQRLELINSLDLFARTNSNTQTGYDETASTSLHSAYDQACAGQPIVFDMRDLTTSLQQALTKTITTVLEKICEVETKKSTGRYPFVFFEEAHFYVTDSAIINIITRGRHIGMASVFVTNSPQHLPDTVFRQLDNLFLLSLTHKDDIRNVSKNSFTDEDTIQSFATRMPVRHALIMGNVTDRYPLIVKIDDLPEGVSPTGRTKSTWDRFDGGNNQQPAEPSDEYDDMDDVPF